MRLRTTLIAAFLALAGLQVVAMFLALGHLNSLLVQQQDRRIDASLKSANRFVERLTADVDRSMNELAQSDELERIAAQAHQGRAIADAAESLMPPRGLSVLSIFDDKGVTLSSGHLKARLGDKDATLFAAAEAFKAGNKAPRAVAVELRSEAGLSTMPAVVAARPVDYGDRRLWLVGGVLLDAKVASSLSEFVDARIELWSQERLIAESGVAAAPVVTKPLSLSPAVDAKVVFSRAELVRASRTVSRAFLALIAIGLTAVVLAAFFLSRRVTRPVEELTGAARKIASGELEAKVSAKASGEIRELVDAFNRMTDDLRSTTEQLVATERVAAWQEVARRLAHEIKNPLTPIQMSLETLIAAHDAQHPEFQRLFKESAGAVLEEVARLRRIVDEFSRFARLPKPQLQPVDLSELASSVLSLYSSPREGVALTHSLEPGLQVRADRDQLTQVVLNLLKNAEEAISAKGRIQLRTRSVNGAALLEVEDSGPGIKPEQRAKVFEPYFTTKEGGTGLGLAIASRICIEHGGKLEVDNAPQGGAVFTLSLPKA
jgi:two-component system, NtrC family, nitrogen regulation sensor histidine kinase NtrY